MSDSQKQTVDRYYAMLQTTAVAHALRTANGIGLIHRLRSGQNDASQLASELQVDDAILASLLQVLVSVGFLEQYGNDFALSQAARLMDGPDREMGHDLFQELPDRMQLSAASRDREADRRRYRQRQNTRQWTHTSAAIQAAEVLDLGGSRSGLRVLALGPGAGVWIGAMAYRDPTLTAVIVDDRESLDLAEKTFASIDVSGRIESIEADYTHWDVPLQGFDLVLLGEVLQLEDDHGAIMLLGRSADSLRPHGELVLLEPLWEQDGPQLPLAIHSLELATSCQGKMRTTLQLQGLLRGAGFGEAQWGWLTASHQGLGLVLASKAEAGLE